MLRFAGAMSGLLAYVSTDPRKPGQTGRYRQENLPLQQPCRPFQLDLVYFRHLAVEENFV